jgi:hypothetical protein
VRVTDKRSSRKSQTVKRYGPIAEGLPTRFLELEGNGAELAADHQLHDKRSAGASQTLFNFIR